MTDIFQVLIQQQIPSCFVKNAFCPLTIVCLCCTSLHSHLCTEDHSLNLRDIFRPQTRYDQDFIFLAIYQMLTSSKSLSAIDVRQWAKTGPHDVIELAKNI